MRLHEQVKYLKRQVQLQTLANDELKRYLNLPKFSVDVSVNKNDILHRLSEHDNATLNTLATEFGTLINE